MAAEASLTGHVGMSASRYTVALRAASRSSTDPQRRCIPVRHIRITISHDRGRTGAPISGIEKCEGTASMHRMGQLLACAGIAAAVLALAGCANLPVRDFAYATPAGYNYAPDYGYIHGDYAPDSVYVGTERPRRHRWVCSSMSYRRQDPRRLALRKQLSPPPELAGSWRTGVRPGRHCRDGHVQQRAFRDSCAPGRRAA